MTNYFDNPALSQSKLKDLKQSPAHFFYKHMMGRKEEPTDAMKFGSLVHTLLLEPHKFYDEFYIMPYFNRKTKEGKAANAICLEKAGDRIAISEDDYDIANDICIAIRKKKAAQLVLNYPGLVEREFYFTDEEFSVECKMKLDKFIEPCPDFPDGVIVDLKTTQDARLDEFARSVYKYGYYNQVAFYCNAIKQIYKTDGYAPFMFIPVEKSPPYESNVFLADSSMLEAGLNENRKLMKLYKECLEKKSWPGYEDKVIEICMASWMLNKLEGENNE
jgi:hypothetical protein